MDLESQIAKSAEWMTGAMPLLNGIRFETTNRRRVAVALLHLSVEHQTGIHVLVDNGVIGSAFAPIRPQFETFVRGAWYLGARRTRKCRLSYRAQSHHQSLN